MCLSIFKKFSQVSVEAHGPLVFYYSQMALQRNVSIFQKSCDPSHIKDDTSKLSHLISKLVLKLEEEDSTVSTEMENLACE